MNYLSRILIGAISLLIILASCSDMGEPEVLLPQMEVDITSIDFSTVTIGSPQIRQIPIINSGAGQLTGELTLVQDSSVYVLQPQGAFTLSADDTLSAELTFTPHAEFVYGAQILINGDDLGNPEHVIALTGVGTALPVPALTVSNSNLNFGTILTGSNGQQQITLSSTGNDTLLISSIDFDLGVYSIDVATPLALVPGASRLMTITFQPDGAGAFSGSMTIVSNSPSTPHVVSLSGAAEVAVSYAGSVQPVLNSNCGGCHGSNGGLNLTSYNNLMAGTSNNGPAVIPGDGASSLIIRRINGTTGGLMPQGGPALSAGTIATIETWINQGALDN
ncbi:MAG: choice-of-anchor D domain-containing protein [Candidatus Marinimicrobia bacterium]|nr:choice-of-anchor D domain-containing protein [FCB group bacterium]MBL7024460.1 choice-of-anchor D domain-containing protein [Candidatus Neomarinimicrobiota bacterium]